MSSSRLLIINANGEKISYPDIQADAATRSAGKFDREWAEAAERVRNTAQGVADELRALNAESRRHWDNLSRMK